MINLVLHIKDDKCGEDLYENRNYCGLRKGSGQSNICGTWFYMFRVYMFRETASINIILFFLLIYPHTFQTVRRTQAL